MSRAGAGGSAIRRHAAALGPAGGLALAASPTFAIMALLSAMPATGPAALLCSAAPASPLSGMATMYLLMSAFHLAPWLRLLRAGARRPA